MSEPLKKIAFPSQLYEAIEIALAKRGFSYARPGEIAKAVMELSTFYAKFPKKATPWGEVWCQGAYLAYYLPLNWWRMTHATQRASQVGFFEGLDRLIDFGSGLGSASFAFMEEGISFSQGALNVESSNIAIGLHQELLKNYGEGHHGNLKIGWSTTLSSTQSIARKTLGVFSYSLTELSKLPAWTERCEALMILEPATQDDGRRLMTLRQQLIENGWHIAAPCTHQEPCPLLIHS
jgi:hypothetical protein